MYYTIRFCNVATDDYDILKGSVTGLWSMSSLSKSQITVTWYKLFSVSLSVVIIIMCCILPLLCASRVMKTNTQVASHVKSEFPFRSELYYHWHVLSVSQGSFYGTILKEEDKQRYGNTITYTYTVGVNGRKFAARISLLNVSVLFFIQSFYK